MIQEVGEKTTMMENDIPKEARGKVKFHRSSKIMFITKPTEIFLANWQELQASYARIRNISF